MTSWRSNTGIRSGVPITPLASGRQPFGKPRNGFSSSLFTKRNVVIAAAVFSFLIIVAIGRGSGSEKIEEELGLTASVQESMIRSGLPSVEIQIIDSTVVLEGTVATQELKEAATRVACCISLSGASARTENYRYQEQPRGASRLATPVRFTANSPASDPTVPPGPATPPSL